jgi:hypothetical protein
VRTITVAGQPLRARFGVLPDALGALLSIAGVSWILGSELFRRCQVFFDLQRGTVVFRNGTE